MSKENIKSPRNSPTSKAYKLMRRDMANAIRRAAKHAKRVAYFAKRRAEKRRNAYLQGRMHPDGNWDMARAHRSLTRGLRANWVEYQPVAKHPLVMP